MAEIHVRCQSHPICFGCHEAIEHDQVYAPADCEHPDCPSVVWHLMCLAKARGERSQPEPTITLNFRNYTS